MSALDHHNDLLLGESGPTARIRGSEVPSDFPDELRQHAREAYRELRDLARQKGAKEPNIRALHRVIMARPRRPIVRAAHDCVAWWEAQPRPLKDVVSAYRNWLDRESDLAVTELLPGASLPDNVTPIRGRICRDPEQFAMIEEMRREMGQGE